MTASTKSAKRVVLQETTSERPHPHQAHGLTGSVHGHRAPVPVHLTRRQLDVLYLLCQGLSNKQISRHLNISEATVKVHISSILRELDASNRLQAVLLARHWRLVGECAPDAPEHAQISRRHTHR